MIQIWVCRRVSFVRRGDSRIARIMKKHSYILPFKDGGRFMNSPYGDRILPDKLQFECYPNRIENLVGKCRLSLDIPARMMYNYRGFLRYPLHD